MTDTSDLTKRIERALRQATDEGADRTEDYAAAVLPIVQSEVRKAKTEAWQEVADFALPSKETYWISKRNPHRATETGDQ